MSESNEIDYGVLIDRFIRDFRPVKRLWPVSIRLLLWVLLEAAILAVDLWLSGFYGSVAALHFYKYGIGALWLILVSIAAAWMALTNSIPGRKNTTAEMLLLSLGIAVAVSIVHIDVSTQVPPPFGDFLSTLGCQLIFAALPWLALFWAARRAAPLRPWLIGSAIGVAASCFAIVAELLKGPANPIYYQLLAGAILTILSAIAGAIWLDSERLWRRENGLPAAALPAKSAWFEASAIFPAATAVAVVLLLLVLKTGAGFDRVVPDFDLAIENYQQSLTNFRPNVPSSSLETVLTAYIEQGMPSYMWDFGPEGFKLQGGRFERLADGSRVTYTWFRGPNAGVMCMFRQVNGFVAPPANHSEVRHLLFYRYRGYSVCLINVGGYGDFVSVIVSPISMKPFMRIVLRALSIERR